MKKISIIAVCFLLLTVVVGSGCGNSNTQPDEKLVTTSKFPIVGIVGEMADDNTQFVLTTLPASEGSSPGQTTVTITDDTQIINKDGNPADPPKNYDTVEITDGVVDSISIKASVITIKRSTENKGMQLSESGVVANISSRDIPGLLKKSANIDLPKSFPASSWDTQLPKEYPTIKGARIIEMTNGDWKIFLLSNPETAELYSVTLVGAGGFEWMGFISVDGEVSER